MSTTDIWAVQQILVFLGVFLIWVHSNSILPVDCAIKYGVNLTSLLSNIWSPTKSYHSKYFHDLAILITSSRTTQLQATIISYLDNFNSLFGLSASVPPSLAFLNILFIVPFDNESQIVLLFCSLPSTGFPTCSYLQGARCLHPLSPPHLSDLISYHFPVHPNISLLPVSILFLEHSKHVPTAGHFHLLFSLLWSLFPRPLYESQSHVLQVSAVMSLIREAFLCHSLLKFHYHKLPFLPLCYLPSKHLSPPCSQYLLICALSVSPYWTAK